MPPLQPLPPLPGEVPGLFSSEELAKELMPLEQRRNEDENYSGPPSLYAYFIHRVQVRQPAPSPSPPLPCPQPCGHRPFRSPPPLFRTPPVTVHNPPCHFSFGTAQHDALPTGTPPTDTLAPPHLPPSQLNLHVVVSMDPANELFRSRLESNPALITRASVQWLDAWSGQGMMDIGRAKLMVRGGGRGEVEEDRRGGRQRQKKGGWGGR